MNDLTVLDTCDGCGGACCSEMSAPGNYVTLLLHPEWTKVDDADSQRLLQMPPEARCEIEEYIQHGQQHGFPFRVACLWLMADGRCRWYDWRPSECRDFELNSWTCHHWRAQRGAD